MKKEIYKKKIRSLSSEKIYKDDFKVEEEDDNQDLIELYKKSMNIYSSRYSKQLNEHDFHETLLDSKLNNVPQRRIKRSNTKYTLLTVKKVKKDNFLMESVKKIGGFFKSNNEYLTLRKLEDISEKKYNKKLEAIKINQDVLLKLYCFLETINCNYKSASCGTSVGGISPLTYLVEMLYLAKKEKLEEMIEKYNLLKPYIYYYRTICADGNCFYRAVMFRYLEILILNKNIEILRKIVNDVIESFNSEELKKRRIINNEDINPDLTFKILSLIVDLIKNGMAIEAHQILVKCFSACRKFDYCIILYFRYILYKYIKENEKKMYLKNFPIKIGNLLPSQFENEKGDFLFNDFYEKYLLKFYTFAEKIIIYLTPFVLGIELNIVVCDLNETDILQKFAFEGKSKIKTDDVISLLINKMHYEIIYTEKDKEKYKNIFQIYENNLKPMVLFNNSENNLKPKTMIIKSKKLDDDNNIQNNSHIQNERDIENNKNNNILNNNDNDKINYNDNINHNSDNSDNNMNPIESVVKNSSNQNAISIDQIGQKQSNIDIKKSLKNSKDMKPPTEIKKKRNRSICIKCQKDYLSKTKQSNNDNICDQCFRKKIFNFFLGHIQNNENFDKKIPPFFTKMIESYNSTFERKLDINSIVDKYKSNECILKEYDTDEKVIKLPCGCNLCSHFIDYFEFVKLSQRFNCKCKKKYCNIDMAKLGYICGDRKIILNKTQKFFQDVLDSNCCHCNAKISKKDHNNKYNLKGFYYKKLNLEEKAFNDYIEKFNHYLCEKCNNSLKGKEFCCKICNNNHIID